MIIKINCLKCLYKNEGKLSDIQYVFCLINQDGSCRYLVVDYGHNVILDTSDTDVINNYITDNCLKYREFDTTYPPALEDYDDIYSDAFMNFGFDFI